MCKIIIVTNTSKIIDIPEFSDKMRELLSESQKDGYGYALQNADNSIFGGKTLKPSAPLSFGGEIPWCERNTEFFGEPKKAPTKAGIFHGRTSTNNVSMINTHPILKEGWALIHNGVVQDRAEGAKLKPRITTNDTEYILDYLIESGVNAVAENISGYYAVGAFSPDGALHIFRDKTARLSCAYSNKLESFVFATTPELIDEIGGLIAEKLWSSTVKDDTYLKFVNGQVVEQAAFKSIGYSYTESKWGMQSLGYSLKADPRDDAPIATNTSIYGSSYGISASDKKEAKILDSLSDDFLDVIDFIDDSYTIIDPRGCLVTATEFAKMRLLKQVQCSIKDLDGKKIKKFKPKEKYNAKNKQSQAV